jgi:hypothetical protein
MPLDLERYGEKELEESATRADELAAAGDHNGEATWRRITTAVGQLVNNTPPGPVHRSERPRNDLAGFPLDRGFIVDNRFYRD